MERRVVQTLIINDDDLECNCKSVTIDNLTLSNVAFNSMTLDRFDLVVYNGTRGQKILKSSVSGTGIIK